MSEAIRFGLFMLRAHLEEIENYYMTAAVMHQIHLGSLGAFFLFHLIPMNAFEIGDFHVATNRNKFSEDETFRYERWVFSCVENKHQNIMHVWNLYFLIQQST